MDNFEEWIYQNPALIEKELDKDTYEALILLNYQSKECKHELAKMLDIDFERMECYQIQKLLTSTLINETISLNSVRYELDVYDLNYINFSFAVEGITFYMHNPFHISDFSKLDSAEKESAFKSRFGDVRNFLESLIDALSTTELRVVNSKSTEQLDTITEGKLWRTKDDELRLIINNHHCFIKKKYIKTKMGNAWLT